MSKSQTNKKVCPEAIARVLRIWNDGTITTAAAMQSLEVSMPQLYRLRTKQLSLGAKLENGILTVTIGKRPETKPRKIDIA